MSDPPPRLLLLLLLLLLLPPSLPPSLPPKPPSQTLPACQPHSLNIFNSRLVLADPESSTDGDYARIEGVVGHEYFHKCVEGAQGRGHETGSMIWPWQCVYCASV